MFGFRFWYKAEGMNELRKYVTDVNGEIKASLFYTFGETLSEGYSVLSTLLQWSTMRWVGCSFCVFQTEQKLYQPLKLREILFQHSVGKWVLADGFGVMSVRVKWKCGFKQYTQNFLKKILFRLIVLFCILSFILVKLQPCLKY